MSSDLMVRNLMFGYATLAEPEYLRALLGERPLMLGANVTGYELFLQRFQDMPEAVRKVIAKNWKPDEFKSYFARKADNPESRIKGVACSLDEKQAEVLDDWEFVGMWYAKEPVKIIDNLGAKHDGFIYSINNGVGDRVVGEYNPWPVNITKTIRLAMDNNLMARRERSGRR